MKFIENLKKATENAFHTVTKKTGEFVEDSKTKYSIFDLKNEIEKIANLQADDDEIFELRQSIRRASESKYHNGTITMSELLRDILNENNAIQTRTIHQLDMLRNIYELKTSLNQ